MGSGQLLPLFLFVLMYTHYFGLKEKPFSIAPDPRYLYMSELHREALAHLLYGISGDGCFILLTGDVGTGKTTVCRCLLEQLPENTDVAFVVNPRLTVLELLATICDEFGISITEDEKSAKAYIDSLNSYLLEAHAKGRDVALLIDEAQNLSLDLLEQLRLLTNLETNQKKLLKIVLLGQTELKETLSQKEAAQISQRITSRYHLLPLNRMNSFAYIHHRLAVAGERQKIFSKTALARIYELSHGIPRLINVLCDRALLGAYVEEKYLVSSSIVDKASREVLGDTEAGGRSRKRLLWKILFVILLLLLGVGGIARYYNKQIFFGTKEAPVVGSEKLAPQQILEKSNSGGDIEPGTGDVLPELNLLDEKKYKTIIRIVPLEVID